MTHGGVRQRLGTLAPGSDRRGPAIYANFLPAALASGACRTAPDAIVVGDGLARIPDALQQLRGGVSAKKLVVTVRAGTGVDAAEK